MPWRRLEWKNWDIANKNMNLIWIKIAKFFIFENWRNLFSRILRLFNAILWHEKNNYSKFDSEKKIDFKLHLTLVIN